MDLGCYGIHALRTLLGSEPVVTMASANFQRGVDASLFANLMFGKVPATVGCSMIGGQVQELRLEGRSGRLTFTGFIAPHEGGQLIIERGDELHVEYASGPTAYETQLEHVVRVFRGEERPRTGGRDSIENMAAIDACLSAARAASFSS